MSNVAYDSILSRRSIRAYKDTPVPEADIEKIIAAGLAAPSAKNLQSAMFAVVTDKEMIAKLSALNAAILGRQCDPFFGAPLLILVFANSFRQNWLQDGSLAMGNLLHAAHALGYGSCWVNRCREMFEGGEGASVKAELGVSGEYLGVGCAVIGTPNEEGRVPRIRGGRVVRVR